MKLSKEAAFNYNKIKLERDALQSAIESAHKREAEAERVILLLIAIGIVDEDKIAQAREIARWK